MKCLRRHSFRSNITFGVSNCAAQVHTKGRGSLQGTSLDQKIAAFD